MTLLSWKKQAQNMVRTFHQSLTVTNTSSAANFIFSLPKKFEFTEDLATSQTSRYGKTDRPPTALFHHFNSVMNNGDFLTEHTGTHRSEKTTKLLLIIIFFHRGTSHVSAKVEPLFSASPVRAEISYQVNVSGLPQSALKCKLDE